MATFPVAMKTETDALDTRVDDLEAAVAAIPTNAAGQDVYSVTEYGGVISASATNDQKVANITAARAAYAACVAAGGGTVYIPAGVFDIGASTGTTSNHSMIEMTPDFASTVTFAGAGHEATTIKLGGTVSAVFSGSATAGASYKNIHMRDFSVNENFVTSYSYDFNSWFVISKDSGFYNLAVRNIRAYNCGALKTSSNGVSERRGFQVTITNAKGVTQRLCDLLIIDNYQQVGGNYALLLQGWTSTRYNPREVYDGTANASGGTSSNVLFDRIYIRNFEYDSGAALAYGATGNSSTGCMIGGYGRVNRLVMDNVRVANSADDLVELGFVEDLTMRNCMLQNPVYEGLYLRNIAGVNPKTYKSRALFDKCTFIHDAGNADKNMALIGGDTPWGDITFRNCTFLNDAMQNTAIRVINDIRSFTVDKCKFIWSANATINPQFSTNAMGFTAVTATPRGGKGTIRITNNEMYVYSHLQSSQTNVPVTMTIASIGIVDHVVYIEGNTINAEPADKNNNVTSVTLNPINLTGGSAPPIESFNNATTAIDNQFIIAAGDAADIDGSTSSGGTVFPSATATLTTEQRRIQVTTYDTGNFNIGAGPFTDGTYYVKGKPGTATLNAFKLGAIGKWINATNYIEAYVTDDGVDSTLHLDKIVAGTRTALTTAVTKGSRLVLNTYTWVSIRFYGNVVTGQIHTSTPTRTSTGTDVITATLSGSDAVLFGEDAQGRAGISWVPADANSMLDECAFLITAVGTVYVKDNAVLRCNSLVTAGAGVAGPTTATNNFRLRHAVISGNDFAEMGSVSGPTDITAFTGSEFADKVTFTGNRNRDGSTDTITGGYKESTVTITANHTVTTANTGRRIDYFGASNITVTLPNSFAVGSVVTIYQGGNGDIALASTGSGTVVGAAAAGTANIEEVVTARVVTNSSGTNAKWVVTA